ncbi:10510_t:CDS:1, partial [Funneliformis mosseae]
LEDENVITLSNEFDNNESIERNFDDSSKDEEEDIEIPISKKQKLLEVEEPVTLEDQEALALKLLNLF